MSETMNKGAYVALARMAREKREQSEYTLELRAVIIHCKDAKQRMRGAKMSDPFARQKIWAHLLVTIGLAEQELKRLGVEV